MATGGLVHITAAAIGISALVVSSALAFSVVKYVGAAYLIYVFLAFLPQFVDPARGPVLAQILVLGAVFVALALLSDSLYALGAGALAAWIRRRRGVARDAGRYAGAAVYLGLGTAAALASRQH